MRRIKNIAVLGSGVMGSGIACHLANAGFEVLMLDMSSDGADKNQIANTALNRALKSSPAPCILRNSGIVFTRATLMMTCHE